MAPMMDAVSPAPLTIPPVPGSASAFPDDPSLYVNRETSWLAFNARVLGEALDKDLPLLERLKFLSIHASNLDEFFMIRVSGLHEQLEGLVTESSPDGLSPKEQLARIRPIAAQQQAVAYELLYSELLPALAQRGIEVCTWDDLDGETRAQANAYFRSSVFPVLTPLAVDPGHPFPFVSNLSLSLAVEVRDPDTQELKFARVKVPESLPRFIPVDNLGKSRPSGPAAAHSRFLPLEQLISENLDQLFPALEVMSFHGFRVTRDMDIDILVDEADDLMSVIDREVRRRRFGACVRLEVAHGVPSRIRQLLMEKLEIDEEDVYELPGLLGLAAFMSIASLERPELRDPPFVPRVPAALAESTNAFAGMRQCDVLLHHPYDSFVPVLDFLAQAAADPCVLAIKMTLYRAGSQADAVRSLIRAAEAGKQVTVSIELKARFDEENNIVWARAMERAGVHVFYGAAGLKTHAKIALVVRREGDTLQRYVHLSTGNYNAATARLYTDVGLFTTDPDIGEDVSELFNALSGFSKQTRYRKLVVAPAHLAETILERIAGEVREAEAGRPAYVYAKLNSLVDASVVRSLYRASMAGVKIDLVVRGMCCLRPGVQGRSENIRVRSIVGRFLEHERVFLFGSPGREAFFVSSADWMPRNFYRRVEVLFPVESEQLKAQLRREVIEPSLRDDLRGYEMQPDASYVRISAPDVRRAVCAQTALLDLVALDPGRRNVVVMNPLVKT
jgi:polyphosphate kinase